MCSYESRIGSLRRTGARRPLYALYISPIHSQPSQQLNSQVTEAFDLTDATVCSHRRTITLVLTSLFLLAHRPPSRRGAQRQLISLSRGGVLFVLRSVNNNNHFSFPGRFRQALGPFNASSAELKTYIRSLQSLHIDFSLTNYQLSPDNSQYARANALASRAGTRTRADTQMRRSSLTLHALRYQCFLWRIRSLFAFQTRGDMSMSVQARRGPTLRPLRFPRARRREPAVRSCMLNNTSTHAGLADVVQPGGVGVQVPRSARAPSPRPPHTPQHHRRALVPVPAARVRVFAGEPDDGRAQARGRPAGSARTPDSLARRDSLDTERAQRTHAIRTRTRTRTRSRTRSRSRSRSARHDRPLHAAPRREGRGRIPESP